MEPSSSNDIVDCMESLTIKSENGPRGCPPGPRGPVGPTGPTGQTGCTGAIGGCGVVNPVEKSGDEKVDELADILSKTKWF